MQNTNFITADRALPSNRSLFSRHGYAIYLFCLLHLLILVSAGYVIVQWEFSAVTKLVLLAVACFVSGWLIYQSINPSLQREKNRLH
jgi:uncharacterized membrane protein YqjE